MFLSLQTTPILLSLRASDRCHWRGNPRPPSPRPQARTPFYISPAGVQIQKRTGSRRFFPPYLAFLNTVSGAVMTTRVLSATDPVRNALPPTTECSPITVSPPRMDAPE